MSLFRISYYANHVPPLCLPLVRGVCSGCRSLNVMCHAGYVLPEVVLAQFEKLADGITPYFDFHLTLSCCHLIKWTALCRVFIPPSPSPDVTQTRGRSAGSSSPSPRRCAPCSFREKNSTLLPRRLASNDVWPRCKALAAVGVSRKYKSPYRDFNPCI